MNPRKLKHVPFNRFNSFNLFNAVAVFLGALSLSLGAAAANLTALDRYVARPDTNYNYKLVNTIPGNGQTTFVIELTSQAWLTTNEVNRPIWKHLLLIVKPKQVISSKALLL